MDSITSEALFRQPVIPYLQKYGVTAASNRQEIYERIGKYDGSWRSLTDKSHRLHSYPKQYTEVETEMILQRYLT